MIKKSIIGTALLFMFNVGSLFSDGIAAFDENYALNFFGNYNIGMFIQNQDANYRTHEPWDIGFGIRYKNISARILIPVTFDFKFFDIEVNSYFEKIYYEFFCKRYQNFRREDSSTDIELDIFLMGIKSFWVHNYKNHSLSSVFKLDKVQEASNGSFLYGFGIFYTSIYSNDETIRYYDVKQRYIYFGPAIGYSYTWIFEHRIFLNLLLTAGPHFGINPASGKVLFIPQVEPSIVIGHHHERWSINTRMTYNQSILLRSKDSFDIWGFATITMMFSKRF